MKKQSERRSTRQRALVLEAVCAANHPTAKEVHETISRTKPIGVGTVYRNLMVLEEEGELASVTSNPEVVRYDRRRDPHYHFCCRKCGKVFDMPLAYNGALDAQAVEESGFEVESHRITFDGVCIDCKRKHPK